MPINNNRPPQADKVKAIQRQFYGDLPPANPTEAFVLAWVEQPQGPHPAGLYMTIVTTPGGAHQWVWIGPGGGGPGQQLPDLRFVVARTGYGGGTLGDIAPGTTYTDPDPAVAFNAALGAATVYQAALQALPAFAGQEAKCTVMLHPDHYEGQFVIPSSVTVVGLGANPSDTIVDKLLFALGNNVSSGARNLYLAGSGAPSLAIEVAPAPGTIRLRFERVESDPNAGVVLTHDGSTEFIECKLGSTTATCFLSSDLLSIRTSYTRLSTDRVNLSSMEDRFIGIPDGNPDLVIKLGDSVIRDALFGDVPPAPPKPLYVRLAGGASVSMLNCSFLQQSTVGGSLIDGTIGDPISTLYVRGILCAGQHDLYGPPSRLSISPFGNHEASLTESLSVVVNAPGFSTAPVSGGTPDMIEVSTVYAVPVSSVTYVLLPLPDANRLAPGRDILVKNTSSPTDPTAGPIALVTTPGQTIDGLPSSPVPASVTSATHVIVAPGSQVTVRVSPSRNGYQIRGI
jgi:hypothetical protein